LHQVETGLDATSVERVTEMIGIDPPGGYGLLIAESLPDLKNLVRVIVDALDASKTSRSQTPDTIHVDVRCLRP